MRDKVSEGTDEPGTSPTALQDATPYKRVKLIPNEAEPDGQAMFLTLLTLSDGQAQAWIQGNSKEQAARVQAIIAGLGRASDRPEPESAPSRTQPSEKWQRLVEALTKGGYSVKEIPLSDHRISFQFDLDSGRSFGTQQNLHEDAVLDESLARGIMESLKEGMGKFSSDLEQNLEAAIAGGDHIAILAVLRDGKEAGTFGILPKPRVLDLLMSLDITRFDGPDRRMVRECRLWAAHALKRFKVAGEEAQSLILEEGGRLDERLRAGLEMIVALGAQEKGQVETALLIWRKLVAPPSVLDASNRAWAWRNISKTLPDASPEALAAAKHSADAFLESGEKPEAGRSLMRAVNCSMHRSPQEAVKLLDEILAMTDADGPLGRVWRAAAHHARGNRLAQLSKHAESLADAQAAAELLRGVYGAEDQLISSLHLAAIEARILGDTASADAHEREANELTTAVASPHFQLARRVQELADEFDLERAVALLSDAEEAGNLEVAAGVRVIRATQDTTLSDADRLSLLEETLQQLERAGAGKAAQEPARLAMAQELAKLGQLERAADWYRSVLAEDPHHRYARDSLLNILWKLEQWGDAAILLKKQLDLVGPMPGLLYAYGRSLSESGDFSGAVTALSKALDLVPNENEQFKAVICEVRENAIRNGGTLVAAEREPAKTPLTREDFEKSLDDFGSFLSRDKRMKFWVRDGTEHSWIPRPEQYAQTLLHTFLKARFSERIDIFEEIGSGAGRIDIYVMLHSDLRFILELKMCGGGYSSTYAASGEDQIRHYMNNKNSHLGYLVVFDARKRNHGSPLLSSSGPDTIIAKFIDLRPSVK